MTIEKNKEHQNHEDHPIDPLTGVELSHHEWDGIRELMNEPPRWWKIIAVGAVIWAFGYWILFPSWPTITGSHLKGILGWTKYNELIESRKEIMQVREQFTHQLTGMTVEDIAANSELKQFAILGGEAAYRNNCVVCHQSGAQGKLGFSPNLRDDDWIWGGKLADIYQTIKYGIRSNHPDTRVSQMPAFGRDGILTKEQVKEVAQYVIGWSNKKYMQTENGEKIFKENCSVCHGDHGQGSYEVGAPTLNDSIWLYGGDLDTVIYTITNSRAGMMPAFIERLDSDTIKMLAIYIHSLGGGQ